MQNALGPDPRTRKSISTPESTRAERSLQTDFATFRRGFGWNFYSFGDQPSDPPNIIAGMGWYDAGCTPNSR